MSGAVALAPVRGKREQTKQANRRAILDAARIVFAEIGYEAASVRDVIRRTPLSVGAFYNYFRSKEEVYQALADDGARRFKGVLRAEYEKADNFEVFIRTALHAYFSFLVSEREASNGDAIVSHPQIRIETPEQRGVFEEVKIVLAKGIERGDAPRVDADYLAAACVGLAQEIGERMLSRRPVDLEAATEFALRMICGGIAALPRLAD